jgi:uncharacterized protein YecT (DUF1311 family)
MIAAIALAVLLLVIVGTMLIRGGSSEDDRLTGSQLSESREDPEKLCSSQKTYDLIKRELFKRAAALRGSDQATFDKLAAYSSLRVEAPLLQQENAQVGSATCNATLTLDLPPGVAVVGGRQSLTADSNYTVQPAADDSGNVILLTNADSIITPLATLAKTAQPATEQPLANEVQPATEPGATADPLAPQPAEPPATASSANPSFDCTKARTAGETAVCNDPRLAALDQRMATQFRSAMTDASPQQRAMLNQTRDAFLRYRDQCPDNTCIAQTYQGRLREIRDIMRGTWQPR